MLRKVAVSYSLNWSFCDRRRLLPCIIFYIYFLVWKILAFQTTILACIRFPIQYIYRDNHKIW
jgi:lipid-A-disaccharide synthase-like uncharacterized protein